MMLLGTKIIEKHFILENQLITNKFLSDKNEFGKIGSNHIINYR